jgi:arylsulfatase A-like enzyme
VLVSIDTLRADRVSIGRDAPAGPATTPRLDDWARAHATVFRQAVAASPWTLPSHATLLTGLDPLRHAANRPFHPLAPDVPTLAERLRARGYTTAALVGGGWLEPAYGLGRGFERWQSWPRAGHGDAEWEQHAVEAAAWLDRLPHPFFLFVHTYDVHDFPRAPRLAPNTPDDERARLYDAAVAHMDAHLAPLLARLAEPERQARTAVIVTSDHGEALGEMALDGRRDYGHGSLRDPVLRVPLIVALPRAGGAPPARVPFVDTQVRAVDVAPTLLALAGLDPASLPLAGEAALDGASLLPLLRGQGPPLPRPALAYFARPGFGLALRDGVRSKYLFDDSALAPAGPAETLFDLADDRDEIRDLASRGADTRGWREQARRLLARHAAGLALRLRAGDAAVGVELRGAFVRDGAPSATDGTRLLPLGPDAARLDLRAGDARELLLQPAGDLRLELRVDGVAFAADTRAAALALRFDGRAWSPGVGPQDRCAARLCVDAAWRGVPDPAERAGAPADSGLAERLRALGYVR